MSKITKDVTTISFFDYRLEIGRERFALIDPRTTHILFQMKTPLIYKPEFHGVPSEWSVSDIRVEQAAKGAVRVSMTGTSSNASYGPLVTELLCYPDHIELSSSVQARRDLTVANWNILEPGLELNLFHVHHWRNRHGHTATFETHNLYQGGRKMEDLLSPGFNREIVEQWARKTELSTYSYDWQFTPRPSIMLFQRDDVMMGLAARDLPQGFGLELSVGGQRLEKLRFNYGGENGFAVSAGSTAKAPRLYLWLDHHGDAWKSVDHYVHMLEEDGEIPRLSHREAPHWWLHPAYCTWNDQGYLSGNAAYYAFPGDTFTGKDPVEAFDAAMLDHLLDIIEKEKYPFGTVIIDAGWEKIRGDWTPNPKKFPNLRAQIDRIHKMGMKAILWIAPYDYFKGSDMLARKEWLCGGGVLGRHGMPLVDYSNPKVQKEYVAPMVHHWFSGERGCLDADGLKLDFMADKIHPVFPIHNPEWRGEERFIHRHQKLWYDLMKEIKPDAQMLGCTAHPHFTDCQDLVRTYDVPVSQHQHAGRAVMIKHFNPGNIVALDLCETKSMADVEEHLDMAFRNNLQYECGRIAPDPKTGVFSLGEEYAPLLRRKLSAWGGM
ncbi:MAG: TIM-barrel domain-containing protein [Victivallales bacterium]